MLLKNRFWVLRCPSSLRRQVGNESGQASLYWGMTFDTIEALHSNSERSATCLWKIGGIVLFEYCSECTSRYDGHVQLVWIRSRVFYCFGTNHPFSFVKLSRRAWEKCWQWTHFFWNAWHRAVHADASRRAGAKAQREKVSITYAIFTVWFFQQSGWEVHLAPRTHPSYLGTQLRVRRIISLQTAKESVQTTLSFSNVRNVLVPSGLDYPSFKNQLAWFEKLKDDSDHRSKRPSCASALAMMNMWLRTLKHASLMKHWFAELLIPNAPSSWTALSWSTADYSDKGVFFQLVI